MHKTQNRVDTTDRAVAEIEALQLVLLQSLSIRRLGRCDIVTNDCNNINKESNKIKNQRIEKITSLCYFI